MARIAASLMLRGVSKSGPPCDRLITSFPSAIIRRATVEIAMVRLGWIRSCRSAVRDMTRSWQREAREPNRAPVREQPFAGSADAGLVCSTAKRRLGHAIRDATQREACLTP